MNNIDDVVGIVVDKLEEFKLAHIRTDKNWTYCLTKKTPGIDIDNVVEGQTYIQVYSHCRSFTKSITCHINKGKRMIWLCIFLALIVWIGLSFIYVSRGEFVKAAPAVLHELLSAPAYGIVGLIAILLAFVFNKK